MLLFIYCVGLYKIRISEFVRLKVSVLLVCKVFFEDKIVEVLFKGVYEVKKVEELLILNVEENGDKILEKNLFLEFLDLFKDWVKLNVG